MTRRGEGWVRGGLKMAEFNQREYQAVILGALLHVNRSRFVGNAGKFKISKLFPQECKLKFYLLFFESENHK
jgi:hypothetical protein